MRNIIFFSLLFFVLYGCSGYPVEQESTGTTPVCPGSSDLPANIANQFEPTKDEQLLDKALGKAKQGKLCQGRVYTSKANARIVLFRAWNSTNPNSQFGNWWALQKPTGRISAYRADYEICYQWSPLDKLVRCFLKPNVKVVIGTGQSAECSEYLTYPASDKRQIYIDNASTSVTDCSVYEGEFNWK